MPVTQALPALSRAIAAPLSVMGEAFSSPLPPRYVEYDSPLPAGVELGDERIPRSAAAFAKGRLNRLAGGSAHHQRKVAWRKSCP